MSTLHIGEAPPRVLRQPLDMDQARGRQGMLLFIGTEVALFVLFFFTWYFLAHNDWTWSSQAAPPLVLPSVESFVLLVSGVVLRIGQKQVEAQRLGAAQMLLAAAIVLGLGFLVVESFEWIQELKVTAPTVDAHGSIFYTITVVHASHIVLGLLMMMWVMALGPRRFGLTDRPPHRAYADVALFWYFCVILWLFVFFILYIVPNIR